MIISYNWLKEFVECDLAPQELADLLTMLGLEVEGMRCIGDGFDSVVVAVVEEKLQHPNADKLSLCRVNDGTEVHRVVCGAQNFTAGDRVALARIGTVLPGDFKIKKSKIRGEESCGMLCSEKELGLADDSAGIMVLSADRPLGTPLFDALGLKDTIFEIGLTPNRADCLSVIGVAREVAAKLGKSVHFPGHEPVESGPAIAAVASVTVEDSDLCPRYAARYISGCAIAPSPVWLVKRLEAVGMRSINNVVDVTNYVLMEYGHPLHAFDFDRLAGGKIIVRRASEGELFTTLDGQERPLLPADLTIRDGERAVALAGIMGGENSEIAPETKNILLESAWFNPSAIRRSSKRLGIHTESSHRFERGADIGIVTRALDRAATLIAELAGGAVAQGILDVYPHKIHPRQVPIRLERVNAVLGTKLTASEVLDIFTRLQFQAHETEPGRMTVTVPTFRVDIEREIDLIEEVARLHGFNAIPGTMPRARVFSDRPSLHQKVEKKLRDLLTTHGFSEVVNFSFFAPDLLDKLLLPSTDYRRETIRLLNPLSDDLAVMRSTLLPGLLQTTERNLSRRSLNLRLFELRRVYHPVAGQELADEPLYLGAILTGRRRPEGWNHEDAATDFFDVKGVLENVFDEFRIRGVSYRTETVEPFYHPGKACTLVVGSEEIGSCGELHPDVLERFVIEQPVYYVELNVEKLLTQCGAPRAIVPPSRYPDTFRDIALLIDDTTPAAVVLETIKGQKIKEMEGVELFDLYTGAGIPEGKKSIAVRVRYRSPDRTLTDEEVTPHHARIIDNLVKKLAITVR
jgi:phenylalanyl-tRNA synthetase beta chain